MHVHLNENVTSIEDHYVVPPDDFYNWYSRLQEMTCFGDYVEAWNQATGLLGFQDLFGEEECNLLRQKLECIKAIVPDIEVLAQEQSLQKVWDSLTQTFIPVNLQR